MPANPKIIVLLAAYNGATYLEEQLDSLLGQRGVDLDVVVSLDNSTDESLSIIQDYMKQYPNLRCLEYGASFGSAGQNFFHLINVVDTSQYAYVAFADQDDIWHEDKLGQAINMLRQNKAQGYSSNVVAFWGDGTEKLIKKSYPQAQYDYLFESPGPGCTFVFTQDLFNALQNQVQTQYSKIKTLWLHDWYCYSFARYNQFKWIIDERSFMRYRQHGSNEVGANKGWKTFNKRLATIFSGAGLDFVKAQASFIGQHDLDPIRQLSKGRLGYAVLMCQSYRLRRRMLHKIFCSIYFGVLFVLGERK